MLRKLAGAAFEPHEAATLQLNIPRQHITAARQRRLSLTEIRTVQRMNLFANSTSLLYTWDRTAAHIASALSQDAAKTPIPFIFMTPRAGALFAAVI